MSVGVCIPVPITSPGRSLGSSTPPPVKGGRTGGGEETYKLLTGIYELIVSDCKHNNSLSVSACLLTRESERETDRKNGGGRGEKVRQQKELKIE